MIFISVRNNIITGIHCGETIGFENPNVSFYGSSFYEIDDTECMVGEPIDFYTDNWTRKPNSQLVKEGLKTIPDGWVLEGEEFRKLTDEELIIMGLREPPKGIKVVDGKLLYKTIDEMYNDGEIGEEEYITQKRADVEIEKERLLAMVTTSETKAKIMVSEKFDSDIKKFINDLLQVENQKGYPIDVIYPIFPTFDK